MIELTPDESRVLGVLIEKDKTTPEQYPLSLNAVVNGCNQKNNRDPVLSMTENQAFDALESLRAKGLVIRSDVPGQRVNKYRHNAPEVLRLRQSEIAIMAELLLRGPQTLGELRGRASRMNPFESLEVVKELLRMLIEREEPMVKLIPPSPGSRAERYMQLLCPDLHDIEAAPATAVSSTDSSPPSGSLAQRVETLEAEVAELKTAVARLTAAGGGTG
ncbi:MAG TPA: YceH family protein [Tepidisphaeraceae bacterium]|jgi:hypothetical protein